MSLEVIYRIALAPAVLASIYRDMTLLKGKIAESTLLGTPKGIHDGLTVKLWSSMQLVHVWVWKSFMEKKKCGPATVGSSLNDELMAFARCVWVSMLCGVGCSEQYLPHRVAMQFGTDEDLSCCVGQCSN
ncbi:hypothetical protein POTOM_003229 [Populus tomentosa]|uniref:Aminotransferase-like plant mobile domain-containing protein n=2 Tax=Populus TaxID=3689 RepID=A0A8X8DLD9_POPTO|nr:hypothetical protein POTOM_003229 [Populus tomentosa]